MQKALLWMLSHCLSLCAWGQVVLTGTVVSEEKQPLSAVMVKAFPKGEARLGAYVQTDGEGRFRLSVPASLGEEVVLRFSLLGYATAERTVPNKAATLDIVLREAAMTFRSATVTAPPVRKTGDTITYHVAALQHKSDRSIGDVIQRIPGVEVSKEGRISYNGLPINRFYIEGLNLLGGRYGIATRNIRPSDVQSVSVLERHQPKKALQGIDFSRHAALNLSLKKSALNRPIGSLAAGLGAGIGDGEGARWMGEAFLLFIAQRRQTIVTAKGNNFGDDYRAEQTDFNDDAPRSLVSTLFGKTPFGAGGVKENRYMENRTAYASAQTLLAPEKERTWKVNATYGFQGERFGMNRRSEYDLASAPVVVEEAVGNALRRQEIELRGDYEVNRSTHYLSNRFALRSSFARNAYALPSNHIDQRLRQNDFGLTNALEWTRRKGNSVRSLSVDAGLSNTPWTQLSAWQTAGDSLLLGQEVSALTAYVTARTRLRLPLSRSGKVRALNLSLVGDAETQTFAHEATAATTALASDHRFAGITLRAVPSFDWRALGISWSASLPFTYRLHDYRNRLLTTEYRLHRPYLSPSLEGYTSIGKVMTFFSTTYEKALGGLPDFITTPLYLTYRSQTVLGSGSLAVQKNWMSNLSLLWQDTFRGQSLIASASYAQTTSDRLRNSTISTTGEEATAMQHLESKAHTWTSRLRASAHSFRLHTNFVLITAYNGAHASTLRQGVLYGITNHRLRLEGATNTQLWYGVLQVDVNAVWERSFRRAMGLHRRLDNFSLTGKVNVAPTEQWEVYASLEWRRNEVAEHQFQPSCFVDGGLRWHTKRWEVELRLRNIGNVRSFVQRFYSELDTYTYTTHLRPAEGLLSMKWNF